MWFTRISKFYTDGFWTKEMVGNAVKANKITADQYKLITGEDYPQ